jgi:tRNA-specific 2-thiouridylase
VSLDVAGAHVGAASFDARGCAAATAAGSAAVELAAGARVLELARTTPDDIAAALGGLGPSHRHAAVLAADALHRALGTAARAGAPRLAPSDRRTLVAMSGGVDSAVAAQLALEKGHEVVGVTLELWADPETDGTASCCSPQAVVGARALAHRMGIPHLTLDLRRPFRAAVVEDFVAEHEAGRTPNPCVRCNGQVRFEAMLALAGQLGAARLATGHYARIARDGGGPLLRHAADSSKDQTYMLARLRPEALERLWFPLGELEKPEVREHARAAGLPVADRRESQDLCFLAGTARDRFLRRHGGRDASQRRPGRARRGPIVDRAGAVVGTHDGQEHFTVGQRRGLGIAAAEPMYVLAKDAASNRVTVGPRSALAVDRVILRAGRLERPSSAVDRVKLRYRSVPIPCRVEEDLAAGPHQRLSLALERAADAGAPGQTACLLNGDAVVGWATIAGPDPDGSATSPRTALGGAVTA